MFLPKLREIKEALTSFFSKPYTTKYPFEPYQASEEFRGFPRYDAQLCIGCGACSQVCPPEAISIIDDKGTLKRILKINYGSCIHCGQCEEKCVTDGGVKLREEYSFSTMDLNDPNLYENIEHELVLCELCNEIISTREQLTWIKNRLGAKAYAHPNFLLDTQKEFFDVPSIIPKSRIRREDQITEVCPKCRHKIIVEDEFYSIAR